MNNKKFMNWFYYMLLSTVILVYIVPVLFILLTAIRPEMEINAKPPVWIPESITFEKIFSLFGAAHKEASIPFGNYLFNSLVTAIFSSTVALVFGTLAGYVFSRFDFIGKNHLFLGLLFLRAIPGIALSLPLFFIFAKLGLIDTSFGLSLVYIALAIPFVAWLMSGYFRDIPKELDDSARTDGCDNMQTFLKIDVPLALPGLGVCYIFVFLTCWNEFPIANIITRTTQSKTFPVGLFDFTTEFAIDWRGIASMSIIMLIPTLLFVFLAHRNLLRGLTLGTLK